MGVQSLLKFNIFKILFNNKSSNFQKKLVDISYRNVQVSEWLPKVHKTEDIFDNNDKSINLAICL